MVLAAGRTGPRHSGLTYPVIFPVVPASAVDSSAGLLGCAAATWHAAFASHSLYLLIYCLYAEQLFCVLARPWKKTKRGMRAIQAASAGLPGKSSCGRGSPLGWLGISVCGYGAFCNTWPSFLRARHYAAACSGAHSILSYSASRSKSRHQREERYQALLLHLCRRRKEEEKGKEERRRKRKKKKEERKRGEGRRGG